MGVPKAAKQQPQPRKSINALTNDEQSILFDAMRPYVRRHAIDHYSARHKGILFYTSHLGMIQNLEDYLIEQNLEKFVPLPAWDPATPAPERFFSYLEPPYLPLIKKNMLTPMPSEFMFPAICDYKDADSLSESIDSWHEPSHRVLGFTDPLFWNFHAFIMDLHERWAACPGAVLPAVERKAAPAKHQH